MARLEKSIVIKAPPGKVWEMLAQDRHLEWFLGYKSVEYISEIRNPEDKYRVGASAHVIATHDKYDATITESVEDEKIVYGIQVKGTTTPVTQTYTLEPAEAGIKLTLIMEYEISNPIIKIVDKFMWRLLEKDLDKSLEKLKGILEK